VQGQDWLQPKDVFCLKAETEIEMLMP